GESGDQFPPRGKGGGPNGRRLVHELDCWHLLVGAVQPATDETVRVATDECPAVRSERHRKNSPGVPGEGSPELERGQIPEPHRLIVARRSKSTAIGCESQVGDLVFVPCKCGTQFFRLNVPEFDRIVGASGGQRPAIRREGKAQNGRLKADKL